MVMYLAIRCSDVADALAQLDDVPHHIAQEVLAAQWRYRESQYRTSALACTNADAREEWFTLASRAAVIGQFYEEH